MGRLKAVIPNTVRQAKLAILPEHLGLASIYLILVLFAAAGHAGRIAIPFFLTLYTKLS